MKFYLNLFKIQSKISLATCILMGSVSYLRAMDDNQSYVSPDRRSLHSSLKEKVSMPLSGGVPRNNISSNKAARKNALDSVNLHTKNLVKNYADVHDALSIGIRMSPITAPTIAAAQSNSPENSILHTTYKHSVKKKLQFEDQVTLVACNNSHNSASDLGAVVLYDDSQAAMEFKQLFVSLFGDEMDYSIATETDIGLCDSDFSYIHYYLHYTTLTSAEERTRFEAVLDKFLVSKDLYVDNSVDFVRTEAIESLKSLNKYYNKIITKGNDLGEAAKSYRESGKVLTQRAADVFNDLDLKLKDADCKNETLSQAFFELLDCKHISKLITDTKEVDLAYLVRKKGNQASSDELVELVQMVTDKFVQAQNMADRLTFSVGDLAQTTKQQASTAQQQQDMIQDLTILKDSWAVERDALLKKEVSYLNRISQLESELKDEKRFALAQLTHLNQIIVNLRNGETISSTNINSAPQRILSNKKENAPALDVFSRLQNMLFSEH